MNATLAAAIIFVVFAVGDMISAKTKAIVSMLLVASVVFLLGFWAGIFPTTMFADSTLLSMAGCWSRCCSFTSARPSNSVTSAHSGAPSSSPLWPASLSLLPCSSSAS